MGTMSNLSDLPFVDLFIYLTAKLTDYQASSGSETRIILLQSVSLMNLT